MKAPRNELIVFIASVADEIYYQPCHRAMPLVITVEGLATVEAIGGSSIAVISIGESSPLPSALCDTHFIGQADQSLIGKIVVRRAPDQKWCRLGKFGRVSRRARGLIKAWRQLRRWLNWPAVAVVPPYINVKRRSTARAVGRELQYAAHEAFIMSLRH